MTVLDRPAGGSADDGSADDAAVAAGAAAQPHLTVGDSGAALGDRSRGWAWVLLIAGAVGIASGVTTVVDKIALLVDPAAGSFCDVDARVGCTPVLLAPQSSVLGPPNALLGVVMFAVLATSGLVIVARGALSAGYRSAMLGLAVFFALFLTWYMQQVAFDIGSLCPFCTVCAVCVLLTVLAASRLAADPDGGPLARAAAALARGRTDVLIVIGWGVLIAAMLYAGIWLL